MKHLDDNRITYTYYDLWQNIIDTFPSHILETFLTKLLLHAQNNDLYKISNNNFIQDKSRYLVQKVSGLLQILISNKNLKARYLIKNKFFIGGKVFPISIIRILCCFISWGSLKENHNPIIWNNTKKINLELGLDDG